MHIHVISGYLKIYGFLLYLIITGLNNIKQHKTTKKPNVKSNYHVNYFAAIPINKNTNNSSYRKAFNYLIMSDP